MTPFELTSLALLAGGFVFVISRWPAQVDPDFAAAVQDGLQDLQRQIDDLRGEGSVMDATTDGGES